MTTALLPARAGELDEISLLDWLRDTADQNVCTGHDYSQPGKPSIDWDDPRAKDTLVSALVNDANVLVAALAGAELDEQGPVRAGAAGFGGRAGCGAGRGF